MDKSSKNSPDSESLRGKSVCVVGVGSLGCLSAQSLVRAGVGRVILIDHDIVEASNLPTQALYKEEDVNRLKAVAAQKRLKEINKAVDIISKPLHLDSSNTHELQADLVFDCTDNFKTRHVINDYCKKQKIPWVFAAVSQTKGQVLVCSKGWEFDSVFGTTDKGLTCEEELLNPAVTMTSKAQTTQGIHLLLGKEYVHDLILCDALSNTFENIKIKEKEVEKIQEEKEFSYKLELCDTRTRIKVIPNKGIELDLSALKDAYTVIVNTPILVVIEIENQRVLVHEFGELNFYETKDEAKVKQLADKIYTYKHKKS